MKNEWDVQGALVAIAEADQEVAGLVALHDKAHPLVEWGDPGMGQRPVTALELAITGFGNCGTARGTIRLNVFVGPGARGLESRIRDRWEAVLSAPALLARGINGRITWRSRPDLSSLEDAGAGKRVALQGDFTFSRA